MKNMQPIKLAAEEPDLYRLYCRTKEGEVSFAFPMKWEGNKERGQRSLDHEDAYYFLTYDDPEGNTIEKCIFRLDEARQQRLADKDNVKIPECIRIESLESNGSFQYAVVFSTPAGPTEHVVAVVENDNTRDCRWEFGSAQSCMDSKGFWQLPKDADPLLQAILVLHQAIYPKYKFDQPG